MVWQDENFVDPAYLILKSTTFWAINYTLICLSFDATNGTSNLIWTSLKVSLLASKMCSPSSLANSLNPSSPGLQYLMTTCSANSRPSPPANLPWVMTLVTNCSFGRLISINSSIAADFRKTPIEIKSFQVSVRDYCKEKY